MKLGQNFSFWWLLTIAGGILICLGFFCLVSPLNAYILLVHYSGITILLNGILLIMISYNVSYKLKEKGWLQSESVIDILFGACLLFNPFMTFIAFPFLVGPWMMAKGFLKMLAALKLKNNRGLPFIFVAGFLSVVFGILIIHNPLNRAAGITIITGFFGLLMGILYLFDSIRYKKYAETLDLLL